MDTRSIAPAKVCSKSRSGDDGVNLNKYTNIKLSFIHCICIFLCVYMCANVYPLFSSYFSAVFVSRLKSQNCCLETDHHPSQSPNLLEFGLQQ